MRRLSEELKEVVKGICEYQNFESYSEVKEVIEAVQDMNFDNYDYIECNGVEIRIINAEDIDELWTEGLIETIKECYNLSNIPDFVEIDWEKTADNCKVDGLGHHFSGYDGSEYSTKNYYYFRNN